MKKIPPYGKPLAELIKSGKTPNNSINLFIGNLAWQKGKNFSVSCPERTLIIPPWDAPYLYWWPVNSCDVIIFDTGYAEQDYINDLVECLYTDGADIARYISHPII